MIEASLERVPFDYQNDHNLNTIRQLFNQNTIDCIYYDPESVNSSLLPGEVKNRRVDFKNARTVTKA